MNNLEMVQEARLGAGEFFPNAIPLDFGTMQALVYPGTDGWFAAIAGDELHYHFPTMAEALDFACAEARCAMH